jgi:hypothetical protein
VGVAGEREAQHGFLDARTIAGGRQRGAQGVVRVGGGELPRGRPPRPAERRDLALDPLLALAPRQELPRPGGHRRGPRVRQAGRHLQGDAGRRWRGRVRTGLPTGRDREPPGEVGDEARQVPEARLGPPARLGGQALGAELAGEGAIDDPLLGGRERFAVAEPGLEDAQMSIGALRAQVGADEDGRGGLEPGLACSRESIQGDAPQVRDLSTRGRAEQDLAAGRVHPLEPAELARDLVRRCTLKELEMSPGGRVDHQQVEGAAGERGKVRRGLLPGRPGGPWRGRPSRGPGVDSGWLGVGLGPSRS